MEFAFLNATHLNISKYKVLSQFVCLAQPKDVNLVVGNRIVKLV